MLIIQRLPETLPPKSDRILSLVRAWRDARRKHLQFMLELHSAEEDCAYLTNVLCRTDEVWVAEVDGTVAGFIAFGEEWVSQLYVAPQFKGKASEPNCWGLQSEAAKN